MTDLRAYQKIIVFGGSFDPPHNAHVRLPSTAMRAVGGDVVLYVPCGVGPLKVPGSQTQAHHRLAMLRLALDATADTAIWTGELQRASAANPNQPTFTVDTLQALGKHLAPGATLRLLVGGDQLKQFDRWRQPQRVVELAEPLVMVRPPDTPQTLLASLPPGYDLSQWAHRLVGVPRIDVSSTQIRRLVSLNQSITGLVPPAVEAYIRDHRLYR